MKNLFLKTNKNSYISRFLKRSLDFEFIKIEKMKKSKKLK